MLSRFPLKMKHYKALRTCRLAANNNKERQREAKKMGLETQ